MRVVRASDVHVAEARVAMDRAIKRQNEEVKWAQDRLEATLRNIALSACNGPTAEELIRDSYAEAGRRHFAPFPETP